MTHCDGDDTKQGLTNADLQLQLIAPEGERRSFALRNVKTFTVGRDEKCTVVLKGSDVSRRHADFRVHENGLTVVDRSQNGTWVDGVLIKRANHKVEALACRVEIGHHVLELLVTPRQKPRTSPALAPIPGGKEDPAGPCEPSPAMRRRIHTLLLDYLELPKLQRAMIDNPAMRAKVIAALERIVNELRSSLPPNVDEKRLIGDLCDEVLGLGPLEQLLADPQVSEIMVVDPHSIFAERSGRIAQTNLRFTDAESVRAIIERIITPLGRRIDESSPLVDARLKDGSRVNAVIPPLAIKGPCITIRKFPKHELSVADLIRFGSMNDEMAKFLQASVRIRRNIVISGGTGSGKTTLLNVLSGSIPTHERIVTIEDAAELRLAQPHVVSLESKPANLEGKGEYTIRDLVRNALRMRPDRIIVGECRGGEALDMLQAMNTGHDGSMTSTHANSPKEAVTRIETLCLMAGLDLPVRAIRAQIASSVHLIVQQSRFADGSRRVISIAEVICIDDHGELELRELFAFKRGALGADGRVTGEFCSTGYLPSFVDQFLTEGLLSEFGSGAKEHAP